MLKTRITEQYGLRVPFINAGMAFIATAPLVRAVCKAGGMGMLGAAAMPPDVLQAALREIKAADPACFGANFIARFSGIEHIEVCLAEKTPVVVFFWDDPPEEWLSRLRAAGSHIWFQVGSVDEAKAAVGRGAEALVVQGSEAGGHNRAAAATVLVGPGGHRCRPVRARDRGRRHCRWPDRCCCAGARRRCGLGRDSASSELRGQRPSTV